ncbi:SET domain-containing protein [Mycena indigotica]|uniref:SET domain-containing protein n=1 Tax=Mycena indigotica TaxID=2126181 RepID=A0A8H6TCQ0_9AGAR|nr:SET domain-containing protein [Mycena indigotica]KAF7315060.1 SET domain-containing protein [Mycena indigotica]
MKRGFLNTGKTNRIRLNDLSQGHPTTHRSGASPPEHSDANFKLSSFSRTYSRSPYIVSADHRVLDTTSIHFLFHPAPSADLVFVDTLPNILLFEAFMSRLPPLPAESPPFIIRDCGHKGVGVFARHAIGRGDLIIRERPVYVSRPGIVTSSGTFYESALAGLSVSAQSSFMSMRNAQPPVVGPILGRIQTNALAAKPPFGSEVKSHYPALFPRLCRLNHDCTPNTHYSFSTETFSGQLFAVRPIQVGEELTLGYVDLAAPREIRKKGLRAKYMFECTCSTCELPVEQALVSDIRRREIARYFLKMADGKKIPDGATLGEAKQLIQYARDEGLTEALSILLVSALRIARRDGNYEEELKCVVDSVSCVRALEGNEAMTFQAMARRFGLTPGELGQVLDSEEPIDYGRFRPLLR